MYYKTIALFLLLIAAPAMAQRGPIEVKNQRNSRLDTTAEQAGEWDVTIATGTSVMAQSEMEAISVSVTVAAGSGFTVFSATGTIEGCSFEPVSAAASYFGRVNREGPTDYFLFGHKRRKFTGPAFLSVRRFIVGIYRLTFESASVDGVYSMECIVKK